MKDLNATPTLVLSRVSDQSLLIIGLQIFLEQVRVLEQESKADA